MTQEVLKLSQEALAGLKDVEKQVRELIAENKALKEALRENAMREVQRLGQEIEQEPVALEAVYETIIQWDEGGGKRSRRELARRIVALYTTPPQLEERNFCPRCGKRTKDIHTCTPPQQKPVELCQYGQEPASCTSSPMDCQCAIDAALAQPEQEPVAWINPDEQNARKAFHWVESEEFTSPVYTSPPAQRTWVGLTDDEIIDVLHPLVMADMSDEATDYEIARAIEAKLKQKNTHD